VQPSENVISRHKDAEIYFKAEQQSHHRQPSPTHHLLAFHRRLAFHCRHATANSLLLVFHLTYSISIFF